MIAGGTGRIAVQHMVKGGHEIGLLVYHMHQGVDIDQWDDIKKRMVDRHFHFGAGKCPTCLLSLILDGNIVVLPLSDPRIDSDQTTF